MAIDRARPLLCFVHSAAGLDSALELIARGRDGWGAVDIVQVRGKDMTTADFETLVGVWVGEVASRHATRIVVNDRVDVALATGADGVHLGRDDLPVAAVRELAPEQFVIGASAHDRGELELAQGQGADYAGLGALYASGTKPEAVVLDPRRAGLAEPIAGLTIPVVAIGGITAERVRDAFAIPVVTGIAVSGAIQCSRKPQEAIRELRGVMERAWRERPVDALQT